MKGIVFVQFADFIEHTFGLDFWDEVLTTVNPISGGVYTTVGAYADEEFLALLSCVCEAKSMSANDAQIAFGIWVFEKLHGAAPKGTATSTDVFDFLRHVQDVIHVEVKKLHADAILPEFTFLEETPTELTLVYHSPRALCAFCEGLILGLGEYLNTPLKVSHLSCVHHGQSQCVMKVTKLNPS